MRSLKQILTTIPPGCDIQLCSHEQLSCVIEHSENMKYQGKYIHAVSSIKFIAVDNTDGNAWTESFRSLRQAVAWLMGLFEISDPSIIHCTATENYFNNHP